MIAAGCVKEYDAQTGVARIRLDSGEVLTLSAVAMYGRPRLPEPGDRLRVIAMVDNGVMRLVSARHKRVTS